MMGDNAKVKKVQYKTIPDIRACKCHKSQTTVKFKRIIDYVRHVNDGVYSLSAKNVHTSNTKIFQSTYQRHLIKTKLFHNHFKTRIYQ